MFDIQRHQREIERNRQHWQSKPLLRQIYQRFYEQIAAQVNPALPGRIAELGSGIGNLKSVFPRALATDLFPNPWLDLVCDAYELPFPDGALSHLILFDVFHHLEFPSAFLREAGRALVPGGRVILFEPFISWTSHLVYGLFHPEPVAWRRPLNLEASAGRPRGYYAAQGNATRLFFSRDQTRFASGWTVERAEAFACFAYLCSGGFSKPALYPRAAFPVLSTLDRWATRFPALFAGRCLVVLRKTA